MDRRDPGRTPRIDQLRPGAVCLMAGRGGPDLVLIVSRDGRREALLLNRRGEADGDLPLMSDVTVDAEVVVLQGAVLASSGPVDAPAPGPAGRIPAALHLTEGRTFLCGRDRSGRLATFDVGSGLASALDVAELPQAARWRVLVPEAGGVVTVYEAAPA